MDTKPNTNYIDNDRASKLLEKWSPVLDYTSNKVGAIEDPHTRMNTAILLENQEEWCLKEANVSSGANSAFGDVSVGAGQAGGTYQNGDTYAKGDARLPKILIPMIRRTFPELITNEIVGVQPMSGPVGLAFALRYKYSGTNLNGDQVEDGGGDGTPLGGYSAAAGTQTDGTKPNAANGHLGGQNAGELGHNYLGTSYTGASGGASWQVSLPGTAAEGVNDDLVGSAHPWLSGSSKPGKDRKSVV